MENPSFDMIVNVTAPRYKHVVSVVERPLHRHAKTGNLSALQRLLTEGADVNETDEHGDTALMIAARSGHCDIIKCLMYKESINVCHINNEEEDVFQIAVTTSDQNTVLETLLHATKNVSTEDQTNPVAKAIASALAKAATLGLIDNIEVFLKSKPSLNVCDEAGNTMFHYAAQADKEEVIVKFSQQLDINVQNREGDTPLHVACREGHHESITALLNERANPCLQNRVGDSVLHCFIRATVVIQGQDEKYGQVFDILLDKWTKWYMMGNTHNDLEEDPKRRAVYSLIRETKNGNQESPMSLAFEVGAVEIIKKLLFIQGTTYMRHPSKEQYDVTDITPITKGSDKSRGSCLELLLEHNSHDTIAQVLDIEPMKKIEKVYTSTTTFIYFIIIFLHTVYMSVFSYSSSVLMDKLRTSPNDHSMDTTTIIFYSITPIEPVCFILELVHRFHCSKHPWSWSRFQAPGTFMIECFSIIHHVIYSLLVTAMLYQYYTQELYSMRNTLSITLLIGWLTTLSFTQGLKPIRFFWRMILHMIMVDVYKILFVYAFVLLSFSFALHVLFQISTPIIQTYPTPFHTMFLVFRLMFGMGELFDDNIKINIKKAGGSLALPIILFVTYIVLASIILLNLLIAMMNTSYSDILTNLELSRRIETFKRSIQLEKTVPFLTKLFNKALIRCGKFDNQKKRFVEKQDGQVWYLQVPRRIVKTPRLTHKADLTLEQMLTQRIDAMDDDFKEHLQQMHKTLESIQKELIPRRMRE